MPYSFESAISLCKLVLFVGSLFPNGFLSSLCRGVAEPAQARRGGRDHLPQEWQRASECGFGLPTYTNCDQPLFQVSFHDPLALALAADAGSVVVITKFNGVCLNLEKSVSSGGKI